MAVTDEKNYLRNSGDKKEILTSKFHNISGKWTQGIFANRVLWDKTDFPIHGHEHYELQYLVSGEFYNVIDDYETLMKPGDFYLVGPESYHSFRLKTPNIEVLNIFIYHPSTRKDIRNLLEKSHCPITGTIPEEDRRMFEALVDEMAQRKNFSLLENTETITISTLLALHIAYRSNPRKIGDNFADLGELQKCLRYILDHSAEPLTLESVAKAIGLSSGYFCRLFSERVGVTFLEYLNRLRIRKSRNMLLNDPQKTIIEIALEVGYGSYSNFYRTFMNIEGISPAEFRKRYGQPNKKGK